MAKKPIALKMEIAADPKQALIDRLAAMPLSSEDLLSTWNPPDWEDVIGWYDEFVSDARKLSANRYREKYTK